VSAVAVSIEFCILIGIFLSFVLYVPRAARIELTELTLTPERVIRERVADDAPCGKILIFDLEGELFFGAAPQLEEHFENIANTVAERGIRVVLLRIKRARNPDAVCLELLEKFIEQMHEAGVVVLLCGVRADVAQVLRACGIEARLGSDHIFRETGAIWSATLAAVRHAYLIVQDDVCDHCPHRPASLNQRDGWNYVV
jgi:SulP family sulfate permease